MGSLLTRMQAAPGGRLPESEARWIFQQLVLGLRYCHDRVRGAGGEGGGAKGLGGPHAGRRSRARLARVSPPPTSTATRGLHVPRPPPADRPLTPPTLHPRTPPQGVTNRDLKLENLLLCSNADPGRPLLKISDFGYSKHDANSSAATQCGTEAYMAPEVVLSTGKYDAKVRGGGV